VLVVWECVGRGTYVLLLVLLSIETSSCV